MPTRTSPGGSAHGAGATRRPSSNSSRSFTVSSAVSPGASSAGSARDHSLQTADLVNELYMRLVEQRKAKWEDRVHFFAICSQLLRRILVDHARRRGSAKRAGEMLKVPLEAASLVAEERHAELIAVDKALEEFAKLDPRKARVVELRFFGGLTIEETGAALGCSEATVEREWRAARAWLNGELRRQLAPRPAGRVGGAS